MGWATETLVALQAAIDDLTVGAGPTVEEIEAAIAAVHGTGQYDHAAAISVSVVQERVIADDDDADLLLIRGDTPQEVTFTWRDADTGDLIDPTAWDDWYLTIKPTSARDDDDDSEVLVELTGTPGLAASGAVTFEFAADDLDSMERDRDYDYDVEARTDAGAIRTFRVSTARLSYDVRRGTA
ncbi:MAG TPA: hypothetical protein VMW48_16010 [Vicinamibacterales bacterium]|nr:hypothetical protein [Vicinamibacterales bacterium]